MTTLDGKQKQSVSTHINLVGRDSPLEHEAIHAVTPSGQTISQILGDGISDDVRVLLEGEYIAKDDWGVTTPDAGATLEIMRVPHGDSIGSILGAVLIAVVAIYAPYALGMYTTNAAGAFAGFTIGGTILTASIFIIGGALLQPAIPGYSSPSSTEAGKGYNAITSTSNRPNPYGVVNKLFGSNWVTPPMAALPYTEVRVDKQFVYVMLAVGYGNLRTLGVNMTYGSARVSASSTNGVVSNPSLDLSTIKIGDTTLDNFTDWELQLGYKNNVNLFVGDIFEDRVQVGYRKDDEPLSVIRTTAPNTSHASLDITFGQGLYSMNPAGDMGTSDSVRFLIQYSVAGANSWVTVSNPTITGNSKDPFAKSYNISFPSYGQYDVKVTRQSTSTTYTDYVYTDAVWTTLRSINRAHTFDIDNVLLLALKVRATDQLSGSLDNVSVHTQTLLPDFDSNGLTGTHSISNNPASAYLEAMIGVQNEHPIPVDRIDFDELVYWRDWCNTNGLTYNYVHSNDETLIQRLMSIPTSAFGNHAVIDGKFTVILDKPLPVSHVINPRNSNSFSATKQFIDLPHAFRVEFIDSTTNQKDEVIAYADGYSAANATKYELLTTIGINNAQQAWKYGRYHLAQAILRPEIYTVSMNIEQLRVTRGDTVKLAYDTMLVGLAWGRVTALTATEITVDELLPFLDGTNYSMLVRKDDGTTIEFAVTAPQGEHRTVNWAQAVGVQVGDIIAFGESTKVSVEAKVSRVSASDGDFNATLQLVDAATNIYDAWSGTVPDFVSNVTIPIELRKPETPIITALESDIDNLVRNSDGSFNTSIDLSWVVPSSPVPTTHVEIRYRKVGTEQWRRIRLSTYETSNYQLAQNIDAGNNYEIVMVSISASDNISAPTVPQVISAFSVADFVDVTVTPTITSITSGTNHLIAQGDGTIVTRMFVEWDRPLTTPNVVGYRIGFKESTTNNWGYTNVTGGNTNAYISSIKDMEAYDVTVTALYVNDIESDSTWGTHVVVGKTEPPSDVTGFTNSIEDRNIVLHWNEVPDLDNKEYEIRYNGTNWYDATVIDRVKTTSWVQKAVSTGSHIWRIKAIDTTGHISTNSAETHLLVVAPNKPNVTSQVIDNNVLLYWDTTPGTLPIETFRINKDGVYQGSKKGEFTTIFETESGLFTYSIVAVDIAGNQSEAGVVTVNVSQPPDYVLNADWDDDFSGSKTNATIDTAGRLVLPVNLTETVQQHFDNNGFSTPQDQVNAGYDYFIQPSPSTASYEQVFDYGTILSSSLVTLSITNAVQDGVLTLVPTISVSQDDISYTDYVGSTQIYANQFRYIKIKLDYNGVGGDDTNAISNINVRLDSKLKSDAGSGTVTDALNGTLVEFNTLFTDVTSITPSVAFGGTALTALYDFVDIPYPTQFTVYLFDANGNKVTGDFSWSARGY